MRRTKERQRRVNVKRWFHLHIWSAFVSLVILVMLVGTGILIYPLDQLGLRDISLRSPWLPSLYEVNTYGTERIGKSNGLFAPVSPGTHPRTSAAWTPHRSCIQLPAPAGQRAGEVWGASPGFSGGEGLGTGSGGRQGRDDGTRACTGSARPSPMGPRHGSWA